MISDLHDRHLYQAGEDIILEGQEARHLFIIESGTVEVWKQSEGNKKIIAKLGAGRIFGEMALIDQSPRMASVTAIDNTVCIRVSEIKLREALDACPPFVKALIKILVSNLRTVQK